MQTERPAADPEIVDANVLERAAASPPGSRHRAADVRPARRPEPRSRTASRALLAGVGPDDARPAEPLPRPLVQRRRPRPAGRAVPEHVVLPRELTGVDARIVVALGDRFPMIGAHKVLAAYGCLAPRLVTGQFDPTAPPRRLALDRQLLPRRRRDLPPDGLPRRRRAPGGDEPGALRLARGLGASTPSDIIRTPGTESNVKEIYDKCARARPPIPRTSSSTSSAEFGNHLVHYLVTGARARARLRVAAARSGPALRLRAFVSATGSAGHDRRRRLPEGALRRR